MRACLLHAFLPSRAMKAVAASSQRWADACRLLPLAAVWLALVLIELASHSYIPIDETRYVTVAWNMWLSGDYLVPTLNGLPYSHKPPLLFWLMTAGWGVFGVNDWWPRLVPSLFALANLWLTLRIADRLWPAQRQVGRLAPVILMGSVLWAVFTTATMFDMLVSCFTLLGMLGLLVAREGKARGWLLLGLAIGGGLLAKGPAILLLLLPAALSAPWWGIGQSRSWGYWYGGLALAVVFGFGLALAWAIPAGLHGGAEYRHAIFWGQTAERMVESFAHRRPFWWYLPLLPVLLFPWLLWLPLWRGVRRLPEVWQETGVRFCLAWLVPVFMAFSLISGKQVHYLLPLFPAFALLAARVLLLIPRGGDRDGWVVLLAALAVSTALVYLPFFAHSHPLPGWLGNVQPWGGVALLAGSVVLWLTAADTLHSRVWRLALIGALAAGLLNLDLVRSAGPAYDVRPISRQLKLLEDAGVPLAHAGEYPGTFNFTGRLRQSPQITTRGGLSAWFARHPDGRAVVYFDQRRPLDGLQPEFAQDYLGMQAAIVDRAQWQGWCARHRHIAGAC